MFLDEGVKFNACLPKSIGRICRSFGKCREKNKRCQRRHVTQMPLEIGQTLHSFTFQRTRTRSTRERSSMSNSILLVLVLLTCIDASHFEGGTLSYKVLNTSGSTVSILLTQTYIFDYTKISCNDSMIVNQSPRLYFNPAIYQENSRTVQCVQYCNQSGGYIAPSVVPYCTDYSPALGITVGQRSDVINITNGSNFLVAYQSQSWRQLSLPVGLGASNTTWSISTWIDLRLRSNGRYNSPPAALIISPIYIPVGIEQSISIPTIDADNDQVRCRFAQGVSECGSACPPSSLPNGTTLLSNCTLFITGAKVGDWYAVAIEIEDFLDSTSTTSFSTVPVQFLINVQNVSSCSQRPLLTSTTSSTGQCVGLQVGQTYEIQLVAQIFCPTTTITDIATLSFPVIIKSALVQNTSTTWTRTLQWTPSSSAVGSQILCAVAIDNKKVQSNQYCVSFTVAQDNVPSCPGEEPLTTSLLSLDTSTIDSVTTHSWLTSENSEIPSTVTQEQSSHIDTTITATTATSSGGSIPWLWIAIALGILLLALVLLGICCCCSPILWSPWKRRRRSSSLNSLSQSSIYLYPIDGHESNLEDFPKNRPPSGISSQCPEDTPLSARDWKTTQYYNILLRRSPKVAPASVSSAQPELTTISSEVNLFGNQQSFQ